MEFERHFLNPKEYKKIKYLLKNNKKKKTRWNKRGKTQNGRLKPTNYINNTPNIYELSNPIKMQKLLSWKNKKIQLNVHETHFNTIKLKV